jgi:hypothetical protein
MSDERGGRKRKNGQSAYPAERLSADEPVSIH